MEGGDKYRNKFSTYKGQKNFDPAKCDKENFWEDPEFDWIKPRPALRQLWMAQEKLVDCYNAIPADKIASMSAS